jgi:hypothetical protein
VPQVGQLIDVLGAEPLETAVLPSLLCHSFALAGEVAIDAASNSMQHRALIDRLLCGSSSSTAAATPTPSSSARLDLAVASDDVGDDALPRLFVVLRVYWRRTHALLLLDELGACGVSRICTVRADESADVCGEWLGCTLGIGGLELLSTHTVARSHSFHSMLRLVATTDTDVMATHRVYRCASVRRVTDSERQRAIVPLAPPLVAGADGDRVRCRCRIFDVVPQGSGQAALVYVRAERSASLIVAHVMSGASIALGELINCCDGATWFDIGDALWRNAVLVVDQYTMFVRCGDVDRVGDGDDDDDDENSDNKMVMLDVRVTDVTPDDEQRLLVRCMRCFGEMERAVCKRSMYACNDCRASSSDANASYRLARDVRLVATPTRTDDVVDADDGCTLRLVVSERLSWRYVHEWPRGKLASDIVRDAFRQAHIRAQCRRVDNEFIVCQIE